MDQPKMESVELFRLMDRVRRAWLSVTPHETLNKSQFATLLAIFRKTGHCGTDSEKKDGVITPSALADAMHQSRPALSQRIHALEELGYVERVPDANDRRVAGLRLTQEGVQVLNRAKQRFDGMLSQAIKQLGEDHAETLVTLLAELADALEAAVEQQITEEGTET